jgi:uncharacterized membrane protein
MIDSLNSRFWQIIFLVFAAVIVAAALRHYLHVWGGISREHIRSDALLLVSVLATIAVLVRIIRSP